MQRQPATHTTHTETRYVEPQSPTPILDQILSPLTKIIEEAEDMLTILRDHNEALAINEELEAFRCRCNKPWTRCMNGDKGRQLRKKIGSS